MTHTAIRSDKVSRSPRDERTFDHNAGAIADQDERARVIARGSRDAIFSARQRHVQRRTVPRPMIEPLPSTPERESDRVIEAVDRAAYANSASAKPIIDTPPVPRDEVVARGQQLSPASGIDERFDSIPTFNPNVNLPRLRRFFHGAAQPESVPPRQDASYDLVLQRAQEFRAATNRQQPGVSDRNSIYASQPASQTPTENVPESTEAAEPETPASDGNPVVWDVNASTLNLVFERARNAIAGQELIDQNPDPDDDRDGTIEVDGIEVVMHHDAPFDTESVPVETWIDEDADAFEDPVAVSQVRAEQDRIDVATSGEPDWIDASAEPEPEWIEESAESQTELFLMDDQDEEGPLQSQPVKPRVDESPRSSWWRSLNFGRKRRFKSEPEELPSFHANSADEAPDAYGYDNGYVDDVPVDDAPPLYTAHDITGSGDDYRDEGDDPWVGDDFTADDQNYAAESRLIRDHHAITSEDSWLEDERFFPDPQPASWYEERTQLLASRPEPDPLPSPVSFGDSRETPLPEREPAATQRRHARREPSSYFAIDEPNGMSAFRAALFSSDPEVDDVDARPADSGRLPASQGGIHDRIDHVFAANRNNEPMPAEPPQRRAEPRQRAATPIRFSQHKAMFDQKFDIRDTISEDDDKPHEYELASRVSKACWTCRSFRAAEEGRRGWCMNEWAPTHRQMVDAEDIACHSSIGDWWIAADTTWIPPTDRIVPETPRTDRLAAQSQSGDAANTRESRRVRTRKVV